MRRKNDRKSKASPEKKTEPAATRRSHRRRRHASSSPDREEDNKSDIENETNDAPPKLEPAIPQKPEGSNSNSEEEKATERPVWQVKSSDPPAGGEIQKLKICLARPSSTPERIDKSPRRHRKHRAGASLSQTDDDSCEEKVKSAKSKKMNDCVESSSEEKVSKTENRIAEDHNSSDSQQVSSTDIDENSKTNEKEEKQSECNEEQVGTSQDVASSDQVYNPPESTDSQVIPDSNENPDQSSMEDVVESKVNGEEEEEVITPIIVEESVETEKENVEEEQESEKSTTPEPRKEHSNTPEPLRPTSTQEEPELSDERSHTPEPKRTKSLENDVETNDVNNIIEDKPAEEPKKYVNQVSQETTESSAGEVSPVRSSVVSVPNPVQCSEIEPTEESTYVADPARKKLKLKETVNDLLTSAYSLTSTYVKELAPDLKMLSLEEIRLEDDHRRASNDSEDVIRKIKKKPFEDKKITIQTREFIATPPTTANPMLANRKISIVGEETTNTLHSPPSPAKSEPSPILYIKNLVRPFTLNQLKELLSRTGTIQENGFWINKIKSECFVHYETLEQSVETRNALHGVHWPVANGRRLDVDFGTEEAMEKAQAPTELKKEIKTEVPPKEVKPKEEAVDWREERERERIRREQRGVREWDVGKHGQERSPTPSPPKRRHQSPPSRQASPERKTRRKEDVPSKLLDDLFRKTKATPCIYWLPLSAEMIVIKEEQRRKHMAEHERRLAEIRRVERMRRPSGRGRDNRNRYD